MLQSFDHLCLAHQIARAASHRLALRPDRGRAAHRAGVGENKGRTVRRAPVRQHLDHLRNDVAGTLDHHRITGTDSLATQLIFVVKGRPRHHHPAHRHRFEVCHRGQRAGPAHLQRNVTKHRHRALGRELVRNGPARRAADLTHPALEVETVDLVDDPIDVVGQIRPLGLDVVVERERVFGRPAKAVERVGHKAPVR